jgi:hypothetical protein
MEEKHKPTTRHRELSLMFLKMGKSLVDEGMENKDYITATLGNAMIFMSSTAFDKEEVKQFSELCNMMSSRRLVKGVRDGSFDISRFDKLGDAANNDPFQEVLRRIKRDLDDEEEK